MEMQDNVNQVAELFLEYVIKNHHVSSSPTSIVQAFQISLVSSFPGYIINYRVKQPNTIHLMAKLLDYAVENNLVFPVIDT